ncbi:MAG: hypothetical protein V8T87_14170 [Victivallales bacterium]
MTRFNIYDPKHKWFAYENPDPILAEQTWYVLIIVKVFALRGAAVRLESGWA